MLKALGVIAVIVLLAAATVGLAGQGPIWLRYIGSGTLLLLLVLILVVVSNMPPGVVQPQQEEVGSEEKVFDQEVPHDQDAFATFRN